MTVLTKDEEALIVADAHRRMEALESKAIQVLLDAEKTMGHLFPVDAQTALAGLRRAGIVAGNSERSAKERED